MNYFVPTETAIDHSKQSKRLIFIDLMRAYAILMMVQGHTIDTVLAKDFASNDFLPYFIWNFFRGITAPVFFFSSGAIFSYLLLRKDLPFWKNERVIKGLKRVGLLLFIGYLLRFNPAIFENLSSFNIMNYQASVACDTLHCIAIGLFILIFLYGLQKMLKIPIWITYPLVAAAAFFLYPKTLQIEWLDIFPLQIATYFTPKYGSNFPIVPWAGFILWGGLYGFILSKSAGIAYNTWFSFFTIILGLFISLYSGAILGELYKFSGHPDFLFLQFNNVQFFHLGSVLIVVGLISIIANKVRIPEFISNTGKNTMMIYVVHVFIIYGTGINKGFRQYFGHSLEPLLSICLAIFMVIFFIFLAHYYDKIKNKYFYKKQKIQLSNIK